MSPLILTAHSKQQRSADMAHSFYQESNFLYLTKINEPDWKVIIVDEEKHLIAPERSEVNDLFEGGMTHEDARKLSGINSVLTFAEGEDLISRLALEYDKVYALGPDKYAGHYGFSLNEAPLKLWQKLNEQFKEVEDCRSELAKKRAIKTPEEIEVIRSVVEQTCVAFESVKQNIARFSYEYQVEAEFGYEFRRNGLDGYAYEPIVAAGVNACTLHYSKNDAKLPDDGLLLIDIGASSNGYNADITRTFAIGEPSKRQRAVHDAVARAHEAIIDIIAPGVSLKDYHERVDDIMKEALSGLGLLNKPEDYRRYFPHAVSHGLGIDVHESLGGYEAFMPGMVLTVEPGVYIPEEGIGVRIEDNILVTEDGNENLSHALPISL